jgi:ergothioneine biosynthesis protein EgtB
VPGNDLPISEFFRRVRAFTSALVAPLEPGDFEAQSMPDASPAKWHLAHTTWFFEKFVLEPFEPKFREYHPKFGYLFNSYYNAVGERQLRSERGLLSRPSLTTVHDYRTQVDQRVQDLIRVADAGDPAVATEIGKRTELGCHHEQQHQELLLTDIKHLFSRSALAPVFLPERQASTSALPGARPITFNHFDGGLFNIGHQGAGFSYDNEGPVHQTFLQPFSVASRVVTNAEFAEFIQDEGYWRAELWLDAGYSTARSQGWDKPLYWRGDARERSEYTLHGERELRLSEPVCHVSFYEADAFARWAGARLAREAEWEVAARRTPAVSRYGQLVDGLRFHPQAADATEASAGESSGVGRCLGDTWEWTQSAYAPYPGYRPAPGALGEYNGKFMINQMVLRGGSCVTSKDHIRFSYRNFFYPQDRWQFSGIRLAKD